MGIITNLDNVVDQVVSTNVNVAAANQAVVDATTKASESAASAVSSANAAAAALVSEGNAAGHVTTAQQAVVDAQAKVVLAQNEVANAQAEVANAQAEVAAANQIKLDTDQLKADTLDYRNDALTYLSATNLKYDEFDDRYLGAKSLDPVLDNDGQAIQEGALYWNMVAKAMKVYTGTAWNDVAAASGALLTANNLSDVPDKVAARTNLGVESTGELDARDTANRARANHTGTQSADTLVDGTANKVYTSQAQIEHDRLNGMLHGIFHSGSESLITVNADTTKYDVAGFTYYINGTEYTYAGETGRSANFVAGNNWMTINIGPAGIVELAKNNFNTPTSLDGFLELGGVGTFDGATIGYAGQSHFDGYKFYQELVNWAKFAKGTNYIGTAGSVGKNGTNGLRLDITSGFIVAPEFTVKEISSAVQLSAVPYYSVAGTPDFQPEATPLTVSDSQYDDGTNLAIAGNNKWLSHNILRSSRTGKIYYVPSQGQFDNRAEAIDAPISLGGFEGLLGVDVSPLAKVIVEKGAGTIDTVIDQRNQVTNTVSASTSDLQTTYERSAEPEIVTNATRQALTITGGTGTDTDNNLEIKNNVGTLTGRIAANGTAEFTNLIVPDGTIDSAELLVTPNGNLSSNRVQSALEELQSEIDSFTTDVEW